MPRKRAKNLLLSAEAVKAGEEYAARHETSVSQLVEDFLLSLQEIEFKQPAKSEIVNRLTAGARYGQLKLDAYDEYFRRERLWREYQQDRKDREGGYK